MQNKLLCLLLGLSLAVNVWQYQKMQQNMPANNAQTGSVKNAQDVSSQTDTSVSNNTAANNLINGQSERQRLLEHAQELLTQQHFGELNTLLTNYLSAHPQDFAFLLVEADLHTKTQLLSEALLGYYDLLDKTQTNVQREQVVKRINKLSQTAIQNLSQTQSWDVLAQFVEPLYQVDSSNSIYSLALARAYAMLGQFNLMESVLTGMNPNLSAVREIRALAGTGEQNETSPDSISTDSQSDDNLTAVPLIPVGQQYLVDVALDGQQSRLLIDTGASVTALSQPFFEKHFKASRYQLLGQFNLHTAAGDIEAPIYTFDEIVLGDVRLHHVSVAVLPMSEQTVDGLLGMNVLGTFHFSIDQQQQLLWLKDI